jgi:hypothetical protein
MRGGGEVDLRSKEGKKSKGIFLYTVSIQPERSFDGKTVALVS